MPTVINSFGYRHGIPDDVGTEHSLTFDIRKQYRNPYYDKSLRYLSGLNPLVQAEIRTTPDFDEKYAALKAQIETHPGPVYIGCNGGHHRSVYLAERLGTELGVPVQHLNLNDK